MNDYDDDYQADLHVAGKERKGWKMCPECKQWLHVQDHVEGSAYCECSQSLPEEEEEE